LANASTAEPAVGENAKRDVSWIGYSVFYFVSSSQTHVVLCRDFKARLFFPLVIESHHGFFLKLIIIHPLRQLLFFSPAVDRGALPLVYLRAPR
jgi:hypothetical protein